MDNSRRKVKSTYIVRQCLYLPEPDRIVIAVLISCVIGRLRR